MPLLAADVGYSMIAIMVVLMAVTTGSILLLTHVVMPWLLRHWRYDPVKFGTYESGVEPFTDARRRFNVRFYLIAVLFLVFDVDIVLMYPWARIWRDVRDGHEYHEQALAAAADPNAGVVAAEIPEKLAYTATIFEQGYTPEFFLLGIGFFFVVLLVGLAYEWRKGALDFG